MQIQQMSVLFFDRSPLLAAVKALAAACSLINQ
jgi:hypothetical protein